MLKGEIKAVAPYGQDLTKLNVSIEPIQGGTPVLYPETESVYLRRATEGTGELMELVGGSVAVNQLRNISAYSTTSDGLTLSVDGTTGLISISGDSSRSSGYTNFSVTGNTARLTKDHVYLFLIEPKTVSGTVASDTLALYYGGGGNIGCTYTGAKIRKQSGDVTGASYLYIRPYYTFNGTFEFYLSLVDLTQMFGPTIADYAYTLEQATAGSGIQWLQSYGFFTEDYIPYSAATLQSVEATAHVTKDANNTTIATYPLDSDLVLRGIPKLDNGVLSYDGDTYEWDGTVTRYFGERAYQAGDESLTDAITDGTNTVYKLTTPTTESADPFTAVQTVEDGGTEEFVTTNGVPVGVVGRFAVTAPLSGYTAAYIYTGDTQGTAEANYTVNFGREVYGGMLDAIDGTVTEKMAEIDEYNGETIGTPWLSSLDVYAEGTTPTKGAQVVYPTIWSEFSVTAPTITTAKAYWWANCGEVDWGYELVGLGLMPVITLADPFE